MSLVGAAAREVVIDPVDEACEEMDVEAVEAKVASLKLEVMLVDAEEPRRKHISINGINIETIENALGSATYWM